MKLISQRDVLLNYYAQKIWVCFSHSIFRSRLFFIYFLFLAISMFQLFPRCSGSRKRDAIKMKLVPKRRPEAQFRVRQQMCAHLFVHNFPSFAENWRRTYSKWKRQRAWRTPGTTSPIRLKTEIVCSTISRPKLETLRAFLSISLIIFFVKSPLSNFQL